MTDPLQQTLHMAATHAPILTALSVAAANWLLVVLAAGWGALALLRRPQLTWLLMARIAASGVVALLITQVLGHVVSDPRPFVAEHYTPLARASLDNGFPSDHTMIAALIAGWAGWLARRWLPVFTLGVLAVALGRLAIGAHHTLDVLGSVVIAGVSLGIASALPWPELWRERPLLARKLARKTAA